VLGEMPRFTPLTPAALEAWSAEVVRICCLRQQGRLRRPDCGWPGRMISQSSAPGSS
jgi:hypothetical protein